MTCNTCGKLILSVPVEWDPVTLVATPLVGVGATPQRGAHGALYRAAEEAGRQILIGEPYITSPQGTTVHERCAA